MDDLLARIACEQGLSQQADQVIALDEAAAGIEEEAAVEVAVPGDAEVGAVLTNSNGRWGANWSTTSPAPPLPELTTIFSGFSFDRST